MTQSVSLEKIAARDIASVFGMLKKKGLDCNLVDLNPKKEEDSEHKPSFIIQGTQLTVSKKKFMYQITIDTEAVNRRNKLQLVLKLQHNIDDIIEVVPQTNGQLLSLIQFYNYQVSSKKLTLAEQV